ncbi:MAG: hypothetical protein MH252_18245 [Thermosynechococcaceae cyanobacterium MS004]|nr:hypothetical protein [Thermosynechococcaceae cyanobacterium MS004]
MGLEFLLLASAVFILAFLFSRWRQQSPASVRGQRVHRQKSQTIEKSLAEPSPTHPFSSQFEAEIRALIEQGNKIEAIKRVRSLTDLDLQRSRDFVEALATGKTAPSLRSDIPPELKANLKNLVRQNQKIQAIQQLRNHTGWGLKESKDYVDRLS